MSKAKDLILNEQDLSQVLPYLRIIGGRLPTIRLTNSTIQHAVDLATRRAYDTGRDIRILDSRSRVVYQAEAL